MQKIEIYFDEVALQIWQKKRESLNSDIQEFSIQLSENHYTLTSKILVDFLKDGLDYIRGLLKKQADDQISKLGIDSEILKANLLKDIDQKCLDFANIHAKILAGFKLCQIEAEEVKIVESVPITSKEEIAAKREQLTSYATTKGQLELWGLLKDVCEGLNAIEKILAEKKILSIFRLGTPSNFEDFFIVKLGPGVKISEYSKFSLPQHGGCVVEPNHEIIRLIN